MKECDVLVIGAGPSGTVAASVLNNNGFNVIIVEKQKFPRFIIGESLLPRCMDNLDRAGLLEPVKKAGFQIKNGARFEMGDQVCDFNFSNQHTKGWDWTWQVPRSEFDKILADTTAAKGVEIIYETAVVDIQFQADQSSITTVESKENIQYEIKAQYLVDGSGFGRVLPKMLAIEKPSGFPVRSALFCHLKDDKRPVDLDGKRITILVHKQDVWIWIIPFSNGNTSVGIVGPPDEINKFDGNANQQLDQWIQLEPKLSSRFGNSEKQMDAQNVKGFAVSVERLYGQGYVLTGNSTEFLDPVFSSGVTFATESGLRAGELISKYLNGEKVNWEKEYADYINYGVNVFRTYVSSWYDGKLQTIFFHSQSNDQIKRQICSVLAGYVWDDSNPFVKIHQKSVNTLYSFLSQTNCPS